MLSRSQYFSLAAIFLLFIAVFTALSPAFVNVDLFYPNRIDSLFVKEEADRLRPKIENDTSATDLEILYNPGSEKLAYENFDVTTSDKLRLSGWYIKSTTANAPTLLILHDLNESKIQYIDMLKQLHDRDINVCMFDLRAHGNSEGKEFSPGMVSVRDVKIILDSLYRKKETEEVYLMGVGLSSFIATQSVVFDDRYSGLILENGFVNYESFLDFYAYHKWGSARFLFMAPFMQKVKRQIQMDPAELDNSRLLTYFDKPTLFIAGGREDFAAASESAILKDSSASEQKELFLIRNSLHGNASETGDEYYNRIVEFIVRTIPPKQKKSRYRKLALQ